MSLPDNRCDSSVAGQRLLRPTTCTMFLLAAVMVLALCVSTHRHRAKDAVPPALSTVNPNTAPWWELTVLPRIGESTGRAIVAYREKKLHHTAQDPRQRAFHRPADLDDVPRIGIKTIERIAPSLRFEDN